MENKYLIFHTDKIKIKKNERQDLSHFSDLFDFTEFIHDNKKNIFWEDHSLKAKGRSNFDYISDIASSVITKYITTNESKEKYLKKGLACCKDILYHVGLTHNHNYELAELIKSKNENEDKKYIVLVLGCQTPEFLKNRAVAAARTYKKLYDITQRTNHLTVFFSGSSPNPDKQQITLYEYKELHNYFFEEIDNLIQSKINFVDIKIDARSHNTNTNISEFLEKYLLVKFTNSNINLFVVSSTFHLIRISQALFSQINNVAISKKLRENKIHFDNIFLIGSENYREHKEIVEHRKYVKNMFYDIMYYFLKNRILSSDK